MINELVNFYLPVLRNQIVELSHRELFKVLSYKFPIRFDSSQFLIA